MSKLQAGRLKGVIEKLISTKQPAFIKERNILYGILMVNEVVDLAKRDRRSCLVLKVDYEKAYYVSWDYLRYVLKRMGFGTKWIRWMEACIFVSSMVVIVNRNYTNDFKVELRLLQGVPLSQLFFVI